MRITGINTSADGVRVIHHGKSYSKSELLAYARNVNEAKYADVSPWLGKSTITHGIDGGVMSVSHKAPTQRKRKCIVERSIDECGFGWDWFFDDERNNNIIAYGNSQFCGTYAKSDFADIFDKIVNDVMVYSYFDYAMQDIERGYADREYKNGKEAIERYNREVDEDVRLFSERFGVTKKEIERGIQIRDIKTFERVL